MDLKRIIKLCKRNHSKAQQELYEAYKDELFFLSLKYCKGKADAQDNLQDAFLSIFRNIKNYKNTGSFEGWMKRIVINKAIDKYKRNKQIILLDSDLLKENTTIDEEQFSINLDELLGHIQNLPDQYRLVFNLYEVDGYSHKDIAELLCISVNTSKSNLHRAKLLLKKRIQLSIDMLDFKNPKYGS